MRNLQVFTGNSNPKLVQEICDILGIPVGKAKVKTFSDGEIQVEIQENVRGMDVHIIQSTCYPSNDNLMELLIMIDALKRASAARIDAVIPYFGYARQDRKVAPRTPISSKLVADLLSVAGAHRILTVDLHAGQIQGFFNIPVDHLYAAPVLLQDIKPRYGDDLVVVSPDAGGTERARAYAKRLKAGLAVLDKRRSEANVSEVMHVIGEVKGKVCVLIDDMIDTAGTICQAADALNEKGAAAVYGCATHPVLSGPALERINRSSLKELVVTNTIPLNGKEKECPKLRCLSVAPLLAEAIRRIHDNESVSSLFV
jgi:ribose-phosphate pyrophosphokinase